MRLRATLPKPASPGAGEALGRKQTPETRAKISTAKKGKKRAPFSPEWRAKISAGMMGKNRGPRTPEVRAKISAALKRLYADPTKNPRWLGGISREPYAWEFNEELKEEVRRRDNHKCQLCGAPQAECEKTLHVHHIDYDKANNDPVNLITLCSSCHPRTSGANRKHWMAMFQVAAIQRSIVELERRKD